MRKLLLIVLFLAPAALWGQNPDCQFAVTFTTSTRSGAFPAQSTATGTPCVSWRVTYQASNMSGVSLTFDGSPDTGAGAPTGVWTTLGAACPGTNPCTIVAGSNPMTDTAESNLQVIGYYPWMSLNMGTFTGTGSVLVKVYGYRGSTASPALAVATFSGSLPAGSNTIGKVDILGNAGAVLDAPGQNVAPPANWLSTGCQFNTSPATITSGNGSPCQVDNTGDLLTKVNAPLPTGANTIGNVNLNAGANTVGKVDILGNAGATMDQAPGSAAPTNALQIGYTDGTNLRVPFADPCVFSTFNYFVINVAVNTQIVAGSAAKNVYVCQFFLAPVTAAANVNIVESATSGNACATAPTGMMGGATAATGATLATNGGFVLPFAGGRAWMKTAVAGDAVCIFTSAAVTGVLSWVQF